MNPTYAFIVKKNSVAAAGPKRRVSARVSAAPAFEITSAEFPALVPIVAQSAVAVSAPVLAPVAPAPAPAVIPVSPPVPAPESPAFAPVSAPAPPASTPASPMDLLYADECSSNGNTLYLGEIDLTLLNSPQADTVPEAVLKPDTPAAIPMLSEIPAVTTESAVTLFEADEKPAPKKAVDVLPRKFLSYAAALKQNLICK